MLRLHRDLKKRKKKERKSKIKIRLKHKVRGKAYSAFILGYVENKRL